MWFGPALLLLLSAVSGLDALQSITCHSLDAYNGYRYDEGSAVYDCPYSACGGQCVALVKCLCGAPATFKWKKGERVYDHYAHIKHGTVIATFDSHGHYDSGHTAVFLGYDTTHHRIKVKEQGCSIKVRTGYYSHSHSYYGRFHVVKVNSGDMNPPHHCKHRHSGC